MAISISEFRALMKQATMTPGNQAMADAAKIATPPGGIPLPNMPKPEEQQDPNQVQQHAVQDAMKYRAELERKDKELAAARRQIQQAENTAQHARNLAEVQKREDDALLKIKEQEMQAAARIRKNEDASMQRIQQQSNQPQVDFKSKEEAHQARLERDSALEKAKRALEMSAERDALTKEKAKRDAELSAERDSLTQEKAKAYADIAAQNAKEYVSTTEKVRRQADAENFTRRKHDAQLESIAQGGLSQGGQVQKLASAPARNTPQQPVKQTAAPVQQPVQKPATPSAPAQAPAQTPAARPQPISAAEQYKKNQEYAKQQTAQRYTQQQAGKWTASVSNATDDSLYGRAVAIATAKNQLHRLQREGNTEEANALQQSLSGLQRDFDTYKKSIEMAAKNGDQEAKNQLARYGDAAYQHGTVSDLADSAAEHGFLTRMWRRFQGKKNLTDFAGQSELERIATQDEREQIRNEVGASRWYDPTKYIGDVVNFVGGGVAKSLEDNARSQNMAERRGVERDWWGDGTGDSAAVRDYQQAAQEQGLKTSVMGNAARIGTESALAAATFIPVGGAALTATRAAGRVALQHGLRQGLKAGGKALIPKVTVPGVLTRGATSAGLVGANMLTGSSNPMQVGYQSAGGTVYNNGAVQGAMNPYGEFSMNYRYPYATSIYASSPQAPANNPGDSSSIWKYAAVAPATQQVTAPTQSSKEPVPLRNRYGTNAIDYTPGLTQFPGLMGTLVDVALPFASQYFGINLNPVVPPKMNEAQVFNPAATAMRTRSYMNEDNTFYQSIQDNYRNHYGYNTRNYYV